MKFKFNYGENIIIHGISKSGKTYLLKYLLKKIKYDSIIIFCPIQSRYQYEGYQVAEYNNQLLKDIINYQSNNKKNKLLIVFDDIFGKRSFNHDLVFKNFSVTNRHSNIMTICLIQSITGFSTTFLKGSQHRFIFYFDHIADMKALYDCYFSKQFKSFTEFNNTFDKTLTKQYQFIYCQREEFDESGNRLPKSWNVYKLK